MAESSGILKIKSAQVITRRIAIAFGIAIGLIRGVQGLGAVFVLGRHDTWATVSLLMLWGFTLLPLALLGIYYPHIAAYSSLASFALIVVGFTFGLGAQVFVAAGLLQSLGFFLTETSPHLIFFLLLLYSTKLEAGGRN